MDKVEIDKKIKNIENDLELLENGRIYELTKGAGIPKCSTLANRMKDDLRAIVNGFGLLLEEETISIDREQFDMLTGQLKGISDEVAILSKKQPDKLCKALEQANFKNPKDEIINLINIGVLRKYQRRLSDPIRYHFPDIYLRGLGLQRSGMR